MVIVEEKIEAPPRNRAAAFDVLLALAAVGGLAATVLLDLPVRNSPFAASDLKTLYASAWCFRHGLNAYSFTDLQAVFRAQGVTAPPSWFGHAPVYPPTTLAILDPLTRLSMVHAAYATTIVSALLFALAVAALLRYSGDHFSLPSGWLGVGWKAALVAVCAAGPLLAFALSLGNVSVASASLSILAFVRRAQGSAWGPGVALALALLLKPHLALWMLLGMLLLPERRARAVATRATLTAAAAGLIAAVALAQGQLVMQSHAFVTIVRAEMAPGGSMNLSSREALPVFAQITSLRSLIGFWTTDNPVLLLALSAILLGLGGILVWRTRLVRSESDASLAIAAWCTLGLLATYHRAHDAVLLLLLAPWLLAELRARHASWLAWAALALYAALSAGPSVDAIARVAASHPRQSLVSFLAFRQAGLATLGLMILLLAILFRSENGTFRFTDRTEADRTE